MDRYGAWVELEPPTEEHQTLFLAPFVALTLGTLALVLWARRRTMGNTDETEHVREPTLPTPDPSLAPWRARILAELEGETP